MSEERFRMRLDSWWQPLLLAGGATHENSYVELSGDKLHLKFGWLFEQELSLSDIESVQETEWQLWQGIGWQTNFLGLFGLIGSYRGVVELTLRDSHRAWTLLRYRRLAVSLEEPQRFVEAVAKAALSAAANGSRPAPAPAASSR